MMVVDSAGKKYGRLTAIRPNGKNKHGNVKWLCKCDCGNYTTVLGTKLRNGKTQSCGCLLREYNEAHCKKHPRRSDPLYAVWRAMRERCDNPNDPAYKNYGGRGIALSDEWHDFTAFRSWAMNNGYERGLTLDRINNDGDYSASNCRWVTRVVNNNNKRNNTTWEYNGRTQTISQWAKEIGINQGTLWWRIRNWDDPKKILTSPVNKNKEH